ncbi:uncharacterized protein [Penaeus vannamei]|uniref:uncharacterized protein n=1 Tax=Penaeus vannamei TaxID=6689 RepID=UPI00387F8655
MLSRFQAPGVKLPEALSSRGSQAEAEERRCKGKKENMHPQHSVANETTQGNSAIKDQDIDRMERKRFSVLLRSLKSRELEEMRLNILLECGMNTEERNYLVKKYGVVSIYSELHHIIKDFTYKLFTKLLTARISDSLDSNQPREQAGFRSGFSTTDHIHTLTQIIETLN